jgi:PBP1b-binding outer membrane lipoprotein LpoB
MNNINIVFGILLMSILFFAGCSNQTPPAKECICPTCNQTKVIENFTQLCIQDNQIKNSSWDSIIDCVNSCNEWEAKGIVFNVTNSSGGKSQCACKLVINGHENIAPLERLGSKQE